MTEFDIENDMFLRCYGFGKEVVIPYGIKELGSCSFSVKSRTEK